MPLEPTTPRAVSWLIHWQEAADLLQIPQEQRSLARLRLSQAGLLADDLLDLADPAVGQALALTVTRQRALVLEAQAEERQRSLARAQGRIHWKDFYR
jgi:hypothetical protein